ncbi:hypothetical protein KM043_008796 [Ampulex compressa]|nr:hypothetical protein KM043_008796 [Ampulex compressa]
MFHRRIPTADPAESAGRGVGSWTRDDLRGKDPEAFGSRPHKQRPLREGAEVGETIDGHDPGHGRQTGPVYGSQLPDYCGPWLPVKWLDDVIADYQGQTMTLAARIRRKSFDRSRPAAPTQLVLDAASRLPRLAWDEVLAILASTAFRFTPSPFHPNFSIPFIGSRIILRCASSAYLLVVSRPTSFLFGNDLLVRFLLPISRLAHSSEMEAA